MNLKTSDGNTTAVTIASAVGKTDCLRLLLSRGAKATIDDAYVACEKAMKQPCCYF